MKILKFLLLTSLVTACNSDETVYNATESERDNIETRIAQACLTEAGTNSAIMNLEQDSIGAFSEIERGSRFQVNHFITDPDVNEGNEANIAEFSVTVLRSTSSEVFLHVARTSTTTSNNLSDIPFNQRLFLNVEMPQAIIRFNTIDNANYFLAFRGIFCNEDIDTDLNSSIARFTSENLEDPANQVRDFRFEINEDLPAIFELITRNRRELIDQNDNNEVTTYRSTITGPTSPSLSDSQITSFFNSSERLIVNPAINSTCTNNPCTVRQYFDNATGTVLWLVPDSTLNQDGSSNTFTLDNIL